MVHFLQPLQHDLVGLESGPDLEQLVHLLERDTLGLGNEEVDVWNGQQHQACEEHVDTVRHLEEHLRCEARDEEVPEPVVRYKDY